MVYSAVQQIGRSASDTLLHQHILSLDGGMERHERKSVALPAVAVRNTIVGGKGKAENHKGTVHAKC